MGKDLLFVRRLALTLIAALGGIAAIPLAYAGQTYTEQAIALATARLPPYFMGHDPEKVVSTFRQMGDLSIKGEYETTQEFEARLQRAQSTPLLGNLTENSIFAFKSYNVQTTYDADRRILELRLWKILLSHAEKIVFSLKTDFGPVRYYEGQNAFGLRKMITERNSKSFNIVLDNYLNTATKISQKDQWSSKGVFHIAMVKDIDVPTAKNTSGNVHILLICSLVRPYLSDRTWSSDATMTSPVQSIEETHSLHARLSELWFYNLPTGEIYAKFRGKTENADSKGKSPRKSKDRAK